MIALPRTERSVVILDGVNPTVWGVTGQWDGIWKNDKSKFKFTYTITQRDTILTVMQDSRLVVKFPSSPYELDVTRSFTIHSQLPMLISIGGSQRSCQTISVDVRGSAFNCCYTSHCRDSAMRPSATHGSVVNRASIRKPQVPPSISKWTKLGYDAIK